VLCPVVFLGGARAAHRGLWADTAPVPPREWPANEKDRKGDAAGRIARFGPEPQGACFQGHTATVH
jgi:hypothetical protein